MTHDDSSSDEDLRSLRVCLDALLHLASLLLIAVIVFVWYLSAPPPGDSSVDRQTGRPLKSLCNRNFLNFTFLRNSDADCCACSGNSPAPLPDASKPHRTSGTMHTHNDKEPLRITAKIGRGVVVPSEGPGPLTRPRQSRPPKNLMAPLNDAADQSAVSCE